MRYNTNLKSTEKLIYGEITSLTNKNGYCFASNRYFANLYNVTLHTVSQWISHLEKLGYINIELIKGEYNNLTKMLGDKVIKIAQRRKCWYQSF